MAKATRRAGENYVRRPDSPDVLSPYEQEIFDKAWAVSFRTEITRAILRTAYAAAMEDAENNLSTEIDEAYDRGYQSGMEMAEDLKDEAYDNEIDEAYDRGVQAGWEEAEKLHAKIAIENNRND